LSCSSSATISVSITSTCARTHGSSWSAITYVEGVGAIKMAEVAWWASVGVVVCDLGGPYLCWRSF
jgi:hypothetical protein